MPQSARELIAEFSKHDWVVSDRASQALAAFGAEAVPPVIFALSDPDGYVRAGAAEALGKIGDQRAFAPLLKAAANKGTGSTDDEENTEARVRAVVGLELLGDRRAVPALLTVLDDALVDDHYLACYVIDTLAVLGDGDLVNVIAPLREHSDFEVRKAARVALDRLGGA